MLSLPSRERGLKCQVLHSLNQFYQSLPSLERGLKFIFWLSAFGFGVAPYTGAWRENGKSMNNILKSHLKFILYSLLIEVRVFSDEIKPTHTEEKDVMTEIQSLGKINTKVLEGEFGKIQSDEIIVLSEHIEHIKLRHPEDYELFGKYGKESVTNPDFVVKNYKNKNSFHV